MWKVAKVLGRFGVRLFDWITRITTLATWALGATWISKIVGWGLAVMSFIGTAYEAIKAGVPIWLWIPAALAAAFFALGFVALIIGLLGKWRRPSLALKTKLAATQADKPLDIPLRDAANTAYGKLRGTRLALMAERQEKTPEGITNFFANAIFQYHPVSANRAPSPIAELVPMSERASMRVFDDNDGIGFISDKAPTYVRAKVSQSVLQDFIRSMRDAGPGIKADSRISLIELRTLAIQHGWPSDLDLKTASVAWIEFASKLRQAALDQDVTIYGRESKSDIDELILREPIKPIDASHWETFGFDVISFVGAHDNLRIEARNSKIAWGNRDSYNDFHVDREQAIRWLKSIGAPQ